MTKLPHIDTFIISLTHNAMEQIFTTLQVITAILLTGAILMQQRGTGFGSAIGGSSGSEVYSTKRGAEKTLFNITVALSVIFLGLGIARIILT